MSKVLDCKKVPLISLSICKPKIMTSQTLQWQSIGTAPLDGSVILVNDTNGAAPWAAAKWLSGLEWSGWVYEDELLQDSFPLGPAPTVWIAIPAVPD
jgi:hypothetical protein